MEPGWWKVKVAWVLSAQPPALRTPRTAARPSAGEQTLRRPASELARAADAPGPGPSCPYDRAGRRRALPSHGKRRPRGCGGPARLRRERAARRGSLEPITLARRPATLPRGDRGLRCPSHLCVAAA